MTTSTVTQKGQVTIPAPVRKALGLDTGDQVRFEHERGRYYLKPTHARIDAAFGLVKARRSASSRDIKQAIKSRAGK